jgi:hypothetical protein
MMYLRSKFIYCISFFNFFNSVLYSYCFFITTFYKNLSIFFKRFSLFSICKFFHYTPWWSFFDPSYELRFKDVDFDGRGNLDIYYNSFYICTLSSHSFSGIVFLLNTHKSFFYSSKLVTNFIEMISFSLIFTPGEDEFDMTFPNGKLHLEKYFPCNSDLFNFVCFLNYFSLHSFRFYLRDVDFDHFFILCGLKISLIRSVLFHNFSSCIFSFTDRFISFKSSYISFIFCIYSILFCFFSSYINPFIVMCYYILFIIYFVSLFKFSLHTLSILFFRFIIIYLILQVWIFNICIIPFLVWIIFYNPFILNIRNTSLYYLLLYRDVQ